MHNALYIGLSRQMTLQRALEVTANNLANVDTAGFKVEQLMLQTDPERAAGLPRTAPLNYVLDQGVARDFGQGALDQTGAPYDVGIDGDGFFSVQTANGTRYTRDGRFTVDAQNRLVDKAGNAVLDAGGAGITLDPQKSAPTIGHDGVVTQADAHGQTTQVGKLTVVHFAHLSALSKAGDNTYAAAPGETPTTATTAVIRQGTIERANVQPVTEITSLIDISRAYERVAQMMSSNEDLTSRAIDKLGGAN